LPHGSLFVGREWELAQLQAGLGEAQAGRGQLFVVTGEAGIGKTRLAAKVADLAEHEHLCVLWGRSWEGEESPAFWPWIQIFRSLALTSARQVGVDGAPGAAGMAHLVPDVERFFAGGSQDLATHPSEQARFRLFDAATGTLRAAAASRPLVLVIEDLHEADRSSLLLLEFVARHLGDMPLLLLATCREPEANLDASLH
jgi:predicted ATPase